MVPARDATLTVVGSGTLFPSAERRSASYHLKAPGLSLLLDCGPGALHGLAAHGIDWLSLDAVAVTHFHPDHASDLVPLIAASRYVGRSHPLTLLGPRGLANFMEGLAAVWGVWVTEPGFPLDVVELEPERGGHAHVLEDGRGGVRVEARSTPHTEASVAFRVGDLLGYTGDTGPDEALGVFFSGCAVLVAECALARVGEYAGHLAPPDVASLARTARPELLLVTHVVPPTLPGEAVASVRSRFDGPTEAARDGMVVRIGDGGVVVVAD